MWYEADISEKPNGMYNVTAYDGDQKDNVNSLQISKLGIKSKVGDNVLSYSTWDDVKYRRYAAKGVHAKTEGRIIYVEYDNGRKKWEDITLVHKLVTLVTGFGKQYFVRYDNAIVGGRWFESDINKQPNGMYNITAHDGDQKDKVNSLQISRLGIKSKDGDNVLAYRTGSDLSFCYTGYHARTNGSKIYVKYSDGAAYWEKATDVHKLVTLYSLVFEPSCKFFKIGY